MADDWHTVPEKTTKRPQRGGRGFHRGGVSNSTSNDRAEFRNHPRTNTGTNVANPSGASGDDSSNWRTQSSQPRRQPQTDRSAMNRSRSRPRQPPVASLPVTAPSASSVKADNQSFKLQTSNMFAVHVGKGSRARKNDDLKEFFETRDDDEGEEETFDAIDDDDLDVSDYESEDDADEATSFPPMPILIRCPLCAAHHSHSSTSDEATHQEKEEVESAETPARPLITSAAELTKHLRDAHKLVFKNLNHMVLLLQRYLDAWAEELNTVSVADIASKTSEEDDSVVYHIDAASCPTDRKIRELVQKANLEAILLVQESERRREALEPRKCLFCKHTCDNRSSLFRHGYREHNFNIGLPDNLVNVNEFLHILESKLASLQCLYCEKTFTSAAVLRKHMRKKKHFKISSHNRLYDRFYIVNYVEPGKSWEAIENEKTDSDAEEADRKDDSWNDWDEKADMPAKSLFDPHVASSVEECLEYMKREYSFDLLKVKADCALDFYKTVALVNIIRRSTAQNSCFACGVQFDSAVDLAAHIKQSGADHLQPPADDSSVWQDKDNLKPVVENDPLLMAFDDDVDGDDSADEETSRKRLEEFKKTLRKKLGQMTLAESPTSEAAPDASAADPSLA
ncbi:hypothetical protein H4R27_002080 [Coemansia aciculifera]|nr:hypothetical protein H4R27_002080 [Coemansia aciculifera]